MCLDTLPWSGASLATMVGIGSHWSGEWEAHEAALPAASTDLRVEPREVTGHRAQLELQCWAGQVSTGSPWWRATGVGQGPVCTDRRGGWTGGLPAKAQPPCCGVARPLSAGGRVLQAAAHGVAGDARETGWWGGTAPQSSTVRWRYLTQDPTARTQDRESLSSGTDSWVAWGAVCSALN